MYIWCWLFVKMRHVPEYIVIFLILMVTCSTYYLHWVHAPEPHDHDKYRFRRHISANQTPQVDSKAVKDPQKITTEKPLLRNQPVSTTRPATPIKVPIAEPPVKDRIVVAVPTHNRIGYVQLTSTALKGTFPAEDIWIFNDKSSEYSTDDLLEWYGTEHVWQSTKRLKADAMARHILEWFLKTKYDVLVLLDSDLLVSPNWLSKLRDGLRESTGLLSVYRSGAPKHKSLSCGAVLCRQPSMGNAGTVWRRALVKKMLSEMPNRDGGFDWGWSEWCAKNKVPMEALKESAVLHIGMHGSWSHETSAEKSVGFPMDELSAEVRQQAEHFLKGAKPIEQPKAVPTWQSFPNVWLPRYYQMAYANPEARTQNDLEKVKQTCIKLGCVAVTVEQNGWLAYFRNIPLDKSKWEPKSRSTMWVMSKYLVPTTKQPDMKYGCSRHAHACRRDPEPGSAPCCAHVMLEIMSDMSRVLRKHNIHWRLTQGQQLSVARNGFVQLWDHNFDPNFDQPEKAKAVIEQEMHIAGKASKYREADYYYTKRVAERLNTDWSKYKVMGGDFSWNVEEFHDPYALQRNPTFMDIGQNHDAKPTAETTFPCLPGYDILCSKRWFEEVVAEFHSGYQRPSSGMPQEQIPYSGYVNGTNNLMFDENGHERDAQSRADTIRKYISDCPNFWEKPCLTSTKPQKSDILWVIPAFKRAWSLDLVLKSLTVHEAAKILVSKDADSAEIDSVLKKYTADVISHPWSCSKHPNRFPARDDTLNENYKGDSYGNPRSSWATCLKHHWWWMMKQAWARKPARVCVLEDDTVIHPQAFQWLVSQSGNVKLTPDEIAVPWCMSAKEWQAIDPKAFCEHDDYNWDQTIAWMKEHGHGPNEAVVPSVSLSMHVGDCGGWDAGGRDKACTSEQIVKIRANVQHWLGKPVAINTIKKKWLTAHSKPNGGWGHPKDWAHCMGDPTPQVEDSITYCILFTMPRVNYAIAKYHFLQLNGISTENIHMFMGTPKQQSETRDLDEFLYLHTIDKKSSLTDVYKWMLRIALSFTKYTVIIEDDLQLGVDFVKYLKWGQRVMKKDNTIFSVSAWHDNSHVAVKPNKNVFLRADQFMGLGWLVASSRLPLLESALTNCKTWDTCVHKAMKAKGLSSIFPQYARVYHMPWKVKGNDFHMTQQIQPSANAHFPDVDDFLNYETYICSLGGYIHPLNEIEVKKFVNDKKLYIKSSFTRNIYGLYDGIAVFVDSDGLQHIFTNKKLCNAPLTKELSLKNQITHIGKKSNGIIKEKHHDEYSLSEHHRLKKFKHGPELTGDALKRVLLNVLKHVSEVMQTCNIEYIIWAGTLLGALRHHGFIPWDNDVDILIKASSEKSLLSCIETRDEMPFTWIIRHGKHSDIIPIKVVDKNSGYYVDIFMCWEQADGTCEWRFSTPNNYYPLKDLFPSKPCMFDSLVVTCPSKPRAVLKRTYKSLDVPAKYAPVPTFSEVKWVQPKIIQTSDLFAAIDYNAPENKGPWKQGWDYDYDGRFKDDLTVHVVPHSHNDPGWIKTYHTYYSTQTRHILDTVVAALTEDPRRTFIWAEISYFSLWWDDASQQQKEQAKKLVAEKRLDFVTGGWVMNDEASVTARATRWHLQEGREWLQNTFGITPQYSWAIDPFGHSAGQAQVLKELGYKGMLIQRVHYAVKKQLAQKQQLEFQWQTPAGEIFTHMMPFYSYDGPHTCGPDPSVCCQFDFARIGKGKTWTGCPWGKMAVEITNANVAERSITWLDQVYKKAMLYRGKHVLIPVGDDFRYQTMDEAHKQFINYQKMFDWIGKNVPTVKVSFSTLSRYFAAVRETNVPKLQGSFFPYSDREKDYWTGYFNSRIFYKGYDRLLESLIAAVERKCPSVDIHLQKRALGLFQHHDGITGTAKSHVVQDYYKTMQKAVTELQSKLKLCLAASLDAHVFVNPLSVATPTMKADEIRPYEEDTCVSKNIQFDGIKLDEHGHVIQINETPVHESLVWRSNKPGPGVAGAYLMAVTGTKDILQPKKHTTCVAKQYKQVETTFDMLKRRIRVYNDGTIEFIYDVDIHVRNNGELWAVYKPEWTAERLCSDVHGLTWECHAERRDAPLQAKFWPMPTMAWLASSSERLTFTGAQPTGVGFHEGAMVIMLDRRGDQDDARGLGQGITDSRPVEMRFGVVMETEILKERASEKVLSVRNWMLNPAIELV